MSYASDALLKETAAKVAELEKLLSSFYPKDQKSYDKDISRLDGEIKAIKMRMGKRKD